MPPIPYLRMLPTASWPCLFRIPPIGLRRPRHPVPKGYRLGRGPTPLSHSTRLARLEQRSLVGVLRPLRALAAYTP